MSIPGDIATQVANLINSAPAISVQVVQQTGGTSSFTSTQPIAEVTWLPLYDLPDIEETKVAVVPRRHETVVASRTQLENEVAIDVGIQKRLKYGESQQTAEIDYLVSYSEEIRDRLAFEDFTIGANRASFLSASSETLVAPDHLEEMRSFTHVLTVTYRVISTP